MAAAKLSGPVGRAAPNAPADVKTVQELLNRHIQRDFCGRPLPVDGRWSKELEQAIATFQRLADACVMTAGRIEPGTSMFQQLITPPGIFGYERRMARIVFGPNGKMVIAGLLYPLTVKATADYRDGMRRFGVGRKGGRKHAGIDLYAPQGTVVRAMADGTVTRVVAFYAGTHVIEVDHGIFIARYGEVDPQKSNIYVSVNESIKRGQKLGLVGRLVGISVPSNMLHLEMYAKTSNGELTVKTNPPFQRRDDLIDPTASIDQAIFFDSDSFK